MAQMGCKRCQEAEFDKERACPPTNAEPLSEPLKGLIREWNVCRIQDAWDGLEDFELLAMADHQSLLPGPGGILDQSYPFFSAFKHYTKVKNACENEIFRRQKEKQG